MPDWSEHVRLPQILLLVYACGISLGYSRATPLRAQQTSLAVASPRPLTELIDLVRPSVVQIVIRTRGPAPAEYSGCFAGHTSCVAGTGFFINSAGYAVTAFHVVDGYVGVDRDGKPDPHPGVKEVIAASEKNGTHAELQIGVAIPNIENGQTIFASGTQYFSARVIASDPAHDLALIQANVNPFTQMPRSYAGPASRACHKRQLKL